MSASQESAAAAATATAPVAVISKTGCPHCKRCKEALNDAGIRFTDYNLGEELDTLNAVKKESGKTTVPQVFVAGKLIGGADDTVAALESGELKAQIDAAGDTPPLPDSIAQLLKGVKGGKAGGKAAGPIPLPPIEGLDAQQIQALSVAAEGMGRPAGRGGVQRSDKKVGGFCGTKVRGAFTTEQARQWLAANTEPDVLGMFGSPAEALQAMARARLIARADPSAGKIDADTLWRLKADAPPPALGKPLNTHIEWGATSRSAAEVGAELRKRITSLYDEFLSKDGKRVDYAGIAKSAAFATYVDATAELQAVDPAALSREARIALFTNLYNAMIIHGTVAFGAPEGTIGRTRFFSGIVYNVGGGSIPAVVVSPLDPRIHFALVCGAKSCPPIKVFSEENLDAGLQAAGEAFCEGEVELYPDRGVVRLSKIFKWYAKDFAPNQTDRLRYIAGFLPPDRKAALLGMLQRGGVTVEYKEYDWGTND
ncbi:unnamed protein product [Pedinophyceae sp. YPF-701]|nr:unnamed protein product [Pedinophyceae sp. YPF-701]